MSRYILRDEDTSTEMDSDLDLASFIADNEITTNDEAAMRRELSAVGRYWVGGGAAPLFCIYRRES
jgi:hypothetical protein